MTASNTKLHILATFSCAHLGVVYCRVMQKISKRVLAQRAKGPPPPRHSHRAYWMWRRARVALKMKTCVRYVKRNTNMRLEERSAAE